MITTTNPYTGQKIQDYTPLSRQQLTEKLNLNHEAYRDWKKLSYQERGKLFLQMADLLRSRQESLARLITSEMGKVITESKAEIEKCAWVCEYYANNTAEILQKELITSDASSSFVTFQPMGTVFAIMPWNFPFWQVFRAAAPTMMAGNTMVLKHAPNVFGCGETIEKLFIEAGFPENTFNHLPIEVPESETVIAHPAICGVTITGSSRAGKSVAALSGKYLKKCVLELGGSDPFIVLNDADLNQACRTGVCSRTLNSGQVCISAKRFIVEKESYHDFVESQKLILESLVLGDPMLPETDMGPMAREDLVTQLEQQVNTSVKMGAKLITGGYRLKNTLFYKPTLLTGVTADMPVYKEETFGPVSVILMADGPEEAIKIANDTPMGLGASIWTQRLDLAEKMAREVEAGAVFINGMTKSDPRLPFGGTKESGFGRELGSYGLKEFLNIKTIWIK